jgi:OPA family sugar phosphate sensor protein UhpC-like MFS transporter
MALFGLLKTAPHAEPIGCSKKIDKEYLYWRVRIFYSIFVGYAFYYFTRKSFTFAMPGMIQDLGFHKSELGFLATIFALTYGASKLFMGVLSDRSNPRYFMSFGLIITGFCNIFFGMTSSIYLFALWWGFNGIFQGCGSAPCARLLTHWYSQNERGSWWSSWNVSHNTGGALVPLLAAACTYYFGWRYAMYVPGVLCILIGFFLMNRLRDTPQSLGLPPIEDYRNDFSGTSRKKGETESDLSTKEILFKYVLANPYIWLLGAANFFVYVVRIAINDWSALYLVETKNYAQLTANSCVSMFEVGGFCGSLAAGWASDYVFSARRGPVNCLFAFGSLMGTFLFWYLPGGHAWFDSFLLFLIGFTVFGPQMLIGVAAVEFSHKKAASTASGFTGWFAYLGAAVAGWPLGKIAEDYGWEGYFWAIMFCCLLSIAMLLPTWSVKSQKELLAQEMA